MWPPQNPVIHTLAWVVVILAIFAPPAVNRYDKGSRQGLTSGHTLPVTRPEQVPVSPGPLS